MILPGTGRDGGTTAAHRIRCAVRGAVRAPGSALTASVGLALLTPGATTWGPPRVSARRLVEGAGANVEIESRPGKGTTIRLKPPLTLAIVPTLLLRGGDQRLAIPQTGMVELIYLGEKRAADAVVEVRGQPMLRLRGELLSLLSLARVLDLGGPTTNYDGASVLAVASSARKYALLVDKIVDSEEVVVKSLSPMLGRIGAYAGAAVLGDGNLALVLDVGGLGALAGLEASDRARLAVPARAPHRREEVAQHAAHRGRRGAALRRAAADGGPSREGAGHRVRDCGRAGGDAVPR